MKNATKLISMVAILIVSLVIAQTAATREMDLRKMMGSNFGFVQKILSDLIRSDFTQVPKDVMIIEQHSFDLIKTPPKNIGADKQVFLALADSLQLHAKNLRVVAAMVIEHDKQQVSPDKLNIDYLRNTAAAHYGQMVTTCVACHNLFRRAIPVK